MADLAVIEKRRAVTARHAASLIVLKGARDPSILMGLRGAVDRADATAPVATALPDITRTMLEKAARPRLAQAIAAAAARELEEETGFSLGDPPALDGIRYLCRAITPPTQPVRFNARFLTVDADRLSGSLAGSGELEDLRWYGLEEALALDLAFVTKNVLQKLQDWLAMDAPSRDAFRPTPLFRNRGWKTE